MKLKSNEPFWLVKNGLIASYPSLKKSIDTEILIIGGGITGSLIAHQCVADGFKTVVIDKREIANGSSSATTSMLQYEIDVPLHKLIEQIGEDGAVASYKACYESIDTLGSVVKEVRCKCGFKKKHSLYYAALKKDVADLMKEYETRKRNGFPVTWLSPADIEMKYEIHNTQGGILSNQGASIDAFRFVHDALQYNIGRGLHVYDKTEAVDISYSPNGVKVRTDKGYEIKADKLIYCNGFESVEVIKEKFVDLISTYAIVSEVLEEDLSIIEDTLVWNTANPYIYLRTTRDNRILIGGEDVSFVNALKRDKLIPQKTKRLEKQMEKILPQMPFTTDFSWAGTFGETKDGLPYIGKHPDFPSTYFVLGFGGNGITFSVIGMEMIASFLKGEEHYLSKYFKFKR